MNELQQAIVTKGLSLGWDMSGFSPVKFSADQMLELFAGKLAGIDISSFSIPEMAAEEMEAIRIKLSEAANYSASDEHLRLIDSISPDNIFIKNMMKEVTCFFADTVETTNELRRSLDAIEEISAVEITEKMLKVITIEYLPEEKALVTTPVGRFVYRVSETETYRIFKGSDLTSLKLKKDAIA